jgi:hypothetical protein
MSQHDYIIDNGTGSAVRADINSALTAIAGANSGSTAPSTTYAYQLWADTSTNKLKIRNGGNSAWLEVGDLTSANLGLILATRFPNVNANVTASDEELNKLDGVTATTTELNLLAGATQLGVSMTAIYPVGSVFTSVVSTNPATLLAGMSGTTWVSFGAGRTLIGIDSGDADFNSVEETGGSKTNTNTTGSTTLSLNQIPSHNHDNSSYNRLLKQDGQGTIAQADNSAGEPNLFSSASIQSAGGGQGHTHSNNIDIVQPYIVVYFWKRTA